MRKSCSFVLLAISSLLLASCSSAGLPISSYYSDEELENLGEEITTEWVDYSVPISSVSFPQEEISISLDKGETYTYHPTLSPKEAKLSALIWTSQNENVATIDNGQLIAVGGGETFIVVSSKNNTFSPINLTVNVTVKLTDFSVSPDALDLDFNESSQLSVTYSPTDTTQKGVTFTVLDEEIASVSSSGLVTAKAVEGTTKIRVTSEVINLVKDVDVVVKDKTIHASGVVINNKVNDLEVDHSVNIEAVINPGNALDRGLIYSSSNEDVATIDENGLVTALNEGTTTIKATSHENSDISDEFILNVYQLKADELYVESNNIGLVLNAKQQINVTYKKAGEVITPSRTNLKFEMEDAGVASVAVVNETGFVTAKSVGVTTLKISDTYLDATPNYIEITINVTLDIVTYTINNFEDWTPNDGSDVFAWAWGGDIVYPGSWYKVTLHYTETGDIESPYTNVSGEFSAPRNIDGFNLVRCKNGTVTPDWDVIDDSDGRIYNKTENFEINGLTTYTANPWIKYPENQEDDSGFGFIFLNGDTIKGIDDGVDANQKQQFKLENVEFKAGDKFALYDFANQAKWIEDVELYSFGGKPENPDVWKGFIALDEDYYLALTDFTADIYLKINYQGNSVYFGLLSGEPIVPPIEEITYHLVGSFNDWTAGDENALTKIDDNHYQISNVTLLEGDELKVLSSDDEWFSNASEGEGYTLNNGNVKVINAGTYVVDFYVDSEYNNHIVLTMDGPEVTNVDILSKPNKLEYQVGEELDTTGLIITVFYDNETQENLSTGFNVTGFDSSTPVESQTITVTYQGHYATFNVKIIEAEAVTYYLVGTFNEWTAGDENALTKIDDNHYQISDVVLVADDELKVLSSNDEWFSNASEGEGYTLNNGNVKVNSGGTYVIDFYVNSEYNNHIVLTKGSQPVESYKVTFEIDFSSPMSWESAVYDYSIYIVLDDDSELLGSWDDCRGNITGEGATKTFEADVPEGRSIVLVIVYFYQGSDCKQSNDIDCDIDATGTFIVTLGITSWSNNTFEGATIAPKE